MKLRVKFSKHGSMRFIGHLDTMRFFQKAIRRSRISISYTTGFSPHQVMAFAQPLGVGLESDGEYLDIEVDSITSTEQMVKQLDEQMCEGFEILDIRLLPDNAGNAMASVTAASYKVTFRDGKKPVSDIAAAVERFRTSENVIITKQTKKNQIELDLKQSVYELRIEDDSVYMLVDASSGGNIKPELVIRTLLGFYDEELSENALLITRLETYGLDDNSKLIPLIEFGKTFM